MLGKISWVAIQAFISYKLYCALFIAVDDEELLQHLSTFSLLINWFIIIVYALIELILLVILFMAIGISFTKRSFLFMGKDVKFEKQLDRELGIPFCSELYPKLIPIIIQIMIKSNIKRLDVLSDIDNFIAEHPTSFLGYIIKSYYYKRNRQYELAVSNYKLATDICKTHPLQNPNILQKYLLKSIDMDNLDGKNNFMHNDPNHYHPLQLKEIVPNKIWAISQDFIVNESLKADNGVFIQCSIIKLNDNSIAIINPFGFNSETIKVITDNIEGEIKYIITPCKAHGAGVAKCCELLPSAKLYGTDVISKHDRPTLPWTAFLNNDNSSTVSDEQLFKELDYYILDGHKFNEAVFYHKESKTLLGLTDTLIACNSTNVWGMNFYCFTLGMWRGAHTLNYCSQSYNYMFIKNQKQFKQNLNHILRSFVVENIVFGHGGSIINNQNECNRIFYDAFDYVLDDSYHHSFLERIYLPMGWLYSISMFNVLPKILIAAISSKLFG